MVIGLVFSSTAAAAEEEEEEEEEEAGLGFGLLVLLLDRNKYPMNNRPPRTNASVEGVNSSIVSDKLDEVFSVTHTI
jgi:hypothetical protein